MADTSLCRLFLFFAYEQRKVNPCFHDGRQEGYKLCCFSALVMLLRYLTHKVYSQLIKVYRKNIFSVSSMFTALTKNLNVSSTSLIIHFYNLGATCSPIKFLIVVKYTGHDIAEKTSSALKQSAMTSNHYPTTSTL